MRCRSTRREAISSDRRAFSSVWISPVEVGSGHGKDDRETGVLESKATYRGKAAAGVKGNHQVT